MNSRIRPIIALLMLLECSGWVCAQSASNLVQASLVASVSAVKAGEPFTMGVLFKIRPGWHIYWSNPGDAGLPTHVQWTLPPGYTASELHYPVPSHLDQPGGIVVYGYEDEVLFTSTITPPAHFNSLDSLAANITAKVKWLCCADECVPGKTTLNLQLMTGEKSEPANTQLFEQWQTRLPTVMDASPAPLVLSDSNPHSQIVTDQKISDPKAIIPGAVDGMILKVGAPQATSTGTTIELSAQLLKGQTVTATQVPVLMTWAGPDGKTRLGEQINVPIVSGR